MTREPGNRSPISVRRSGLRDLRWIGGVQAVEQQELLPCSHSDTKPRQHHAWAIDFRGDMTHRRGRIADAIVHVMEANGLLLDTEPRERRPQEQCHHYVNLSMETGRRPEGVPSSVLKSFDMPHAFIRRLAVLICIFSFVAPTGAQQPASTAWLDPHRDAASRLLGEALANDFAWQRLAELGDTFGHRLSGSKALEDAIDWAVAQMKKDGLENVRKEPVRVPHWVRGNESLEIVAPYPSGLVMLGLGNSVGTPAEGIEAELLVVRTFEELDAAGPNVKGRIVLFNAPF